MLKSGDEHLESLRDGRVVYVGSERVTDVTTHPLFANAARTVAALYDMKAEPEHADELTYVEAGRRYSAYFQLPRSREDLRRRSRANRRIADLTYGLFGRSPDHVAGFVSGMAMLPSVLKSAGHGFPEHLLAYHRRMREQDLFTCYAVVPPQAARDPEYYGRQNRTVPTLRVIAEDAEGVTISGMKMLATGAILANEIWIGNIFPLAPSQMKESVTCAVPCNASGLSLWSRQPLNRHVATELDGPLAWRFDETDAMLICEDVKVPWERVFVKDDPQLSRDIYIKTPGGYMSNHQSNVRYWRKLRLLVGLASRVAQSTGADQVPAVRETLGRLAALESNIAAMIEGQIEACDEWPDGFVAYNRRMVMGTLNWCTEGYSAIVDIVRELCGGGVFQLPADVSVMSDPSLRRTFETFWATPQQGALARMKLFRLAWDLVGSEFAGRHLQYEKFYAGPSFIVRSHSFREAPWQEFHGIVDDLLGRYEAIT